MAVEVRIPAFLLTCTSGDSAVTANGTSVREVIADLDASYPGIAERLLDESGLRRYVNVYVNGSEIRFAAGLSTAVAEHDCLTILPTVATM